MIHNIISISGGKDSTALALLAIERETENTHYVFADTGHEHAQTYAYVDYLEHRLCVPITRIKADFSQRIKGKRKYIAEHWLADGVSQGQIDRALAVLHPTSNPFLDLCIWKGRFPSTKARFCSEELKHVPINNFSDGIAVGAKAVISWQGVRADESPSRAKLPEKEADLGTWEPEPIGRLIYRPILRWTVADVFAMHKKHGVEPNPLYTQGMGRVGCMPCIHARKDELRNISIRFPDEIARVAEWERIVSEASKRGMATFRGAVGEESEDVTLESHGIYSFVDWSKTARGGRQRDIIHMLEEHDVPMCSSQYGLCE